MVKIIDRLLLKSFISPFIVTFAIAVFFFLMQTLWFYIDDIAGKGLGFFFIVELLAYKCVSLIPLALPLAILISSVMVMGSLAEQYELSSIKSAGVPLLRVMRPLIIFGIASAFLSYYCSATLIPIANLKFGSRMYDVQQQKPALRLDEGIFNDDFQGFSIHIGKKERDGKTIKDVLIYDYSENAKGQYSQISAEEGEMYTTPDGHYFVMNLKNGHQYIEINPSGPTRDNGKYPFVRTSFKSWTKVFDMSEFNISRTNEELFKNNKNMMSIPELHKAIDSTQLRIDDRYIALATQWSGYFSFLPPDSIYFTTPADAARDTQVQKPVVINLNDSLRRHSARMDSLRADSAMTKEKPVNKKPPLLHRRSKPVAIVPAPINRPLFLEQHIDKKIEDYKRFGNTFDKKDERKLYDRAKTFALSIANQSESAVNSIKSMRETKVKYSYEMWTKYSIAVVCIIFVFIGAPMGAIVRKGGFGYPILISIIFFMAFIILTIFCRKIAEAFVLPPAAAAWLPAIIIFPLGLILTFKAMNDSSLQLSETITRITTWFAKRKTKA